MGSERVKESQKEGKVIKYGDMYGYWTINSRQQQPLVGG